MKKQAWETAGHCKHPVSQAALPVELSKQPVVKFKIRRYDPGSGQKPRFETFPVEVRGMMTVMDGLWQVFETKDNTLSFRYACREGICGSCAMFINGSYRLACQTQIRSLKSRDISIGPLPHFTVIKDLVVDMTPFFEKIEAVMPFLEALSSPPEKEWIQSPEQRKLINEVVDCIMCGICYSACPAAWFNKDYLGPAALAKAYRFVADSRDSAAAQRLTAVATESGVWRCRNIFNCADSCPKKISPTDSIA
ncbi:MAG: succinate dehydrogenase iron-sulfur subunit, partial [Chloroflexi bacterium]|nr:succinate dehydrogenase iron-sulfur subunit [Chloroflexota bacterium]